MRALAVLIVVGGLFGRGAEGQERVKDGERVRVEHHINGDEPEMVEGWLVRIHPGDSIVMATKITQDRLSFRTPLVDRFQVYRVDTRSKRMALIGTVAAGLAMYPFTESECSKTRTEVCLGRATSLYAAAGGFLLGALVGSFMEVPTWKDVEPTSFRVPSVTPAMTFDGGVGLTARLVLGF